jgi:hypothetical protein
MKLQDLVPNFYIHVSGSDLYIPKICLIWSLYCPLLHEITLGSTQEQIEGQGTAAKQWLAAIPCPPLCSWG